MKKYEYLIQKVTIDSDINLDDITKKLNELGKQGWKFEHIQSSLHTSFALFSKEI